MTYLMRLNQINFGIITPEKDEPSGLNTYSAKHLCLLMLFLLRWFGLAVPSQKNVGKPKKAATNVPTESIFCMKI